MAPSKSVLTASKKAVDPTLDALFASSFGPVEARAKPKYEKLVEVKPRGAPAPKPVKPLTKEEEEAEASEEEEDDDDEDDEEDEDDDEEEEDAADDKVEPAATPEKPKASKRKRKGRGEDDDDLEGRYFEKLEREIDGPVEKRAKLDRVEADADKDVDSNDSEDNDDDDDDAQPIVHESLVNGAADADVDADAADDADADKTEQDVEKASRTVFLSNVSLKAVTDKAAKRTLTLHLESVQGVKAKSKGKKAEKGKKEEKEEAKKEDEKEEKSIVESIRFRSVPFASAALPKRAAYITGATMGATAQSANAYVVYATVAHARLAVKNLNGTVVLDRHLRADSVAHPSPVDHRRCVFVGNLGFVDDETVLAAAEGEETRKRHKTPMDVEEGLWRTFGKHAGRVESVRVVRDPVTRVGKGIAYVQFYDGTSVEAALLLADKKFAPLLPRALRVSRCKAPHKTARAMERVQVRGDPPAGKRFDKTRGKPGKFDDKKKKTGYTPKVTAEQQTQAGRAAKLLGRQAATETVVFEGMRARVGGVSLFKKNKNNKKQAGGAAGKPMSGNDRRRAERAKNWKGKPARGGKNE